MNGIEFIELQKDIIKSENDMHYFRRVGNWIGYKQAKRHLEKLRRRKNGIG